MVNLVYNDWHRDHKIVTVVDRWFLFSYYTILKWYETPKILSKYCCTSEGVINVGLTVLQKHNELITQCTCCINVALQQCKVAKVNE